MLCPTCQTEARRFGRDRHGRQRYFCNPCRRTFLEPQVQPLGTMRLPMEKAVIVLRQLLEGCSIRSTERLTGVNRDTIIDLMLTVGRKCQAFLERVVREVQAEDVQVDEIWGFVGCKEKARQRKSYGVEYGDAYCFVGLERTSKLVLGWHLGKRTPQSTLWFGGKLDTGSNC